MVAKRWLIIIWLAVLVTASVIIWQMQHENNSANDQGAGPSADVTGQPSVTSAQPPQPDDETTFKTQVLRYYEISNTENIETQKQLLPSVATKRFLDSYRWTFPSDSPTVTTTVDAARSSVEFEESTTDKNVRYVTTKAYVIKIDSSSDERYEELYPPDHTTWIIEADGTWKLYGPTATIDTPIHS